ncbi:hormonally up-regulated neu tumor-associated kinase homolog A-like [Paramormyrops kingsleyae]|uniref:hormonally up-regulated neu tumor-associated kinase homolog A-like n=1 Tax=Paramormyrops kingsleyae TaxID=1676925 RepID=UPI003B978AC9
MPIRTVMDGTRYFGPRSPVCFGPENTVPANINACPDSQRKMYHTKMVGNYFIGRKLGEGSFAKVREGLHAVTGEKVAIKVIDKAKAKKDSYLLKNLHREGLIQQMVLHPNIIQLLDILETEASCYLVMELCMGGNLLERLLERERLEEAEVQKYIRQLVMAVEHLHSSGVVHRDLKVENLLLDENSNIKVTDFGLSSCARRRGTGDLLSTQCGSPAYCAPELISQKKYGPKVDVWSIGVIMYTLLTGALPFTMEPFNLRQLWQKMVQRQMNPLPQKLSPGAAGLLRNLLEPDPARRPSIRQVMADPWLLPANPRARSLYLNRPPMEIDHHVLEHMTVKMGFQHEEVLSAVLKNRPCHTLAVYYLLERKRRRVQGPREEKQLTGKETKRQSGEENCGNGQTPLRRCSASCGNQRAVLSTALEHLNSYPVQLDPPRPIRRQETYPPTNGISLQGRPQQQPIPANAKTHFRTLGIKAAWCRFIHSSPPPCPVPPVFQTYSPGLKTVPDFIPSSFPVAQKPPENLPPAKESRSEPEGPRWRARLPSISLGQALRRSMSFRHAAPAAEASFCRRRMTLSPSHTLR